MRFRLFAVVLLLGLSLAAPAAMAVGTTDPNPSVPRWVEATFDLAQPDLNTMQLTGEIRVHQHDVNGDVYAADDIRASYQGIATFAGQKTGDAFIADLESQVKASLVATLAEAFPTAQRTVDDPVLDRASLTDSGAANAYDPPVAFDVSATIVRSNAELGLGTLGPDAVAAAFASGARVSSSFSLAAQAGYNTRYVVHAPASPPNLVFLDAQGGTLSADGKRLTVPVDATYLGQTLSLAVDVDVRDATATAPTAEDVGSTVTIDLGRVEGGQTTLPVSLNVTTELRAVSVATRFPGALPSKVQLAYVNADGIRALHEAGAISDAQMDKAGGSILASIASSLPDSLQTLPPTGDFVQASLDAASTRPYDAAPAVLYAARTTGSYELPTGGENLDVVLKAGGRVKFDLELDRNAERDTVMKVNAPPGLAFHTAEGATLDVEQEAATLTLPKGAGVVRVTLGLFAPDAPTYSAENAKLDVVVDLKDVDVTTGQALGGDLGELVVDVTVTGRLAVIAIPDDMKATLGDKVELDYLNADAIRLLRQRGVLSNEDLATLESKLRDQVASNLGSALGATVTATGGFDRATLDAPAATPLSDERPVVFTATTSFRKPLAGGAPSTQAAIALYTQQQSFDFPRIQGLETGYTVILPKGLAVTDLQIQGGEGQTGTSADGRDQFQVTPGEEGSHVTVAMAVTPSFVFAKFLPLVLLALLIVLLIIGTPIAIVVVRRRRKKQA